MKTKNEKEFKVFVGSNNDTKKLEINKIERIAQKHFIGFSLLKSLGVYNSEKEKSLIVCIIGTATDKEKVFNMAKELKFELKQYEILISENPTKIFKI